MITKLEFIEQAKKHVDNLVGNKCGSEPDARKITQAEADLAKEIMDIMHRKDGIDSIEDKILRDDGVIAFNNVFAAMESCIVEASVENDAHMSAMLFTKTYGDPTFMTARVANVALGYMIAKRELEQERK